MTPVRGFGRFGGRGDLSVRNEGFDYALTVMPNRLPPTHGECLSRDEEETLRAIVKGSSGLGLRQCDISSLSHLRLIKVGACVLPTALGVAWCRTFPSSGRSEQERDPTN